MANTPGSSPYTFLVMRARNLISFGIAVAVVAACSNPSSEGASDPAAELLSELEPALLLPAPGSATAVVSSAELTPAQEGPTRAATAPRPREAAARIDHTAHVDELRPQVVQTVASIPSDEMVVASAGGASAADDHAGHDHDDHPSPAPGIIIRGGGDTGILGDPCLPGGHRPANGAIAGRAGGILGGIADATGIGSNGTMVNDNSPRIGRGELPYPRNSRGNSGRAGGSLAGMGGGMAGGGRVFIR